MKNNKSKKKKQSLLGERGGPGGLSKTVVVVVVRDLCATGGGSRESWLTNVMDQRERERGTRSMAMVVFTNLRRDIHLGKEGLFCVLYDVK